MAKKVLFVANTDMHINLCYIPYMKYLKDAGFIVHVATNTGVTFPYCDKKIEIPIARTPYRLRNIKAIIKLKRIINQENYELISCSTPMGGVVARIAAKGTRKKNHTKLIYTAHGFHFYKGCSFFYKIAYYPVEKILMRYVDLLITINEEDYNFAINHFHVDTKYIKGIGFRSDKFEHSLNNKEKEDLRKTLGITKHDYVIIYVAELSKRKRQKYLIRCLSNMNLENIKVLFAGNSILKNDIFNLVKKYHLEDKIKILGFRNDISDLLDISDLVISVSKQEGLPLNIMEAMKKEKPIIVTDCRGNRDLIKNNINGIVVPINDERSLIDQINYLKSHKSIALKLGKASKDIIDEYSLDEILPQYAKIYDDVLEVEK